MAKKKGLVDSKKNSHKRTNDHPVFEQKWTMGQRAADKISKFGGSWIFIILFFSFLTFWMGINTWWIIKKSFDPYPFILLNLVLSCLAAIQAPIILMAQNRQAERDRLDAKYDYTVNRKAEREIQALQRHLEKIEGLIRRK